MLAQALRNAIDGERAAKRFYQDLIPKATDPRARQFFELMVEQEEEHARLIETLAEQLEAGELPPHPDGNVASIETVPGWRRAESIDIAEALDLAISAEQNAALYYDAIADCFSGEAAEAFRNLSESEQGHADLLVEMRDRLQGA